MRAGAVVGIGRRAHSFDLTGRCISSPERRHTRPAEPRQHHVEVLRRSD
jgi:hypothetical protein